jgi:hypothetical protein
MESEKQEIKAKLIELGFWGPTKLAIPPLTSATR